MITGMEADTCLVADGLTDVTGETFAGVMNAIYLVTPTASQVWIRLPIPHKAWNRYSDQALKTLRRPSLLSWYFCFKKNE